MRKESHVDQQLFEQVCNRVVLQLQHQNGIGTLGEKTIHAILKHYYVPETCYHEQRLAGFIADAYTGTEIYEIQTRNFNALRRKLDAFLPLCDVTIVYPVAHTKYLRYIDKESGEISAPRKSPKTCGPYAVFPELYRIKSFLQQEHLHIRIALLDVEEYRFLDGWSRNKKKGASRGDALPLAFFDELILQSPADYVLLLPDDLPEIFTTKDFKRCARVSQALAVTALNVLHSLGVVCRIGKQGNLYLYQRADRPPD